MSMSHVLFLRCQLLKQSSLYRFSELVICLCIVAHDVAFLCRLLAQVTGQAAGPPDGDGRVGVREHENDAIHLPGAGEHPSCLPRRARQIHHSRRATSC